jgi:cyclophilin family peptidyl-prolyl cis-trans isomerase
MCHVNVDYDVARHHALFASRHSSGSRVITLSQGMTSGRVPDGFGFPIASNEHLVVFTQVLNHNIKEPNNLRVRHRVTFEYVRDRDLDKPMRPLLNLGASGMVPLNDEHESLAMPAEEKAKHGTSCLMTARAANAIPGSDYTDPSGQQMTGHWSVPPGRQVNVTDVSWFINLPFDAKLHYAAAHLHPFAESITLRDATAKKVLFEAKTKNPKDKVGLDHVDAFSSVAGTPMFRSHKYELVTVYNNTTNDTHDSMASLFLGIADRDFVKPTSADLARREDELYDKLAPETTMIHTSAGDLGFFLLHDSAPQTSKQFARLLRKGLLNGAGVAAIEKNGDTTRISFTKKVPADVQAALRKLPVEGTHQQAAATLSFCPSPDADQVVVDIMVGQDPSRDGRCTTFGRLGPGSQVIIDMMERAIDASRRPLEAIEITGAELNIAEPAARASM